MGADGAATLGTPFGQGTCLQPVKKLQIIADKKFIIGISGPVGVGQRIAGKIGELWDQGKLKGQSWQAMQTMRTGLAEILMPEINYAAQTSKLIGAAAQQAALSQTVLSGPIDKALRLYSFAYTGDPEELVSIPFVAIGSGQHLADPFLAFLRTVFWKDREPNMADGIQATFWSLQHAIRRNTGGVADPKQIMKLYKDDRGNVVIHELEPAELEEAEQAVDAAEEHLSQFDFRKQAAGEPPPIAPPAGE